MDCRTFQKNLEDYLENGLDFSGRFGMERHAQQCIACGEEMARAQRLSRMVRGLERVKAPSTFESSVLNEIARQKLNNIFFRIRRDWVYGLEGLSWRKWAAVGATFAVFGLGFLYWYNSATSNHTAALPSAAKEPAKTEEIESPRLAPDTAGVKSERAVQARNAEAEVRPSDLAQSDLFSDQEDLTTEYIEFSILDSDNLPATIQLPKKIRVQYEQPSEEYFIQNVSH